VTPDRYTRATEFYPLKHWLAKALYAEASKIPADESSSISANIPRLMDDLKRSEGHDAVKLSLLTTRRILEINYDAGL
jgi:hypothetical protein